LLIRFISPFFVSSVILEQVISLFGLWCLAVGVGNMLHFLALWVSLLLCVQSFRHFSHLNGGAKSRTNPCFASWLEDGAKVNGVEVASFGTGLRGIKANKKIGAAVGEDISSSECIVSIPASQAIEVTNTRPPVPFPKFVTQSLWEESLWDQRLAFKLLYEAKVLKGKSEKHSWIKQLPSSYSTPFYWSETLLDEQLQYPSLSNRVYRQRKDWNALFQKWQSSAQSSDCSEFFDNNIKYEDFVWALQTINSRAFNGAFEGSTADQRQQLLLFTGALTLIFPLAGFSTWEQSLTAAVAVGFSIVIRDVLSSSSISSANLKRYVICPYIDMFNHNSKCQSDVSYNYFSNQFEVRTQNYQEGEQVYITYGKQSNDRLLQFYGFVDTQNPHDNYDFNMNIIELLIERADEMVTVGATAIPSSDALPAEERLSSIARALQNTEVTDAAYLGNRRVTTTRANKVPVRLFRNPPNSLFSKDLDEEGNVEIANNNNKNNKNNNKKGSMGFDDDASGISFSASIDTVQGINSRFDDVTVRTLRALYASESEWNSLVDNGNNLRNLEKLGQTLSADTEAAIASALRAFAAMELRNKKTTLEADVKLLQTLQGGSSTTGGFSSTSKEKADSRTGITPSGVFEDATICAVAFRVEKKSLLSDASMTS
jgi:hypothetical protein